MIAQRIKRPFCDFRQPMQRVVLKRGERKKGPIIAYDFETTRIPRTAAEEMRVRPLYLTAYGAQGLLLSTPLHKDMQRTARIIEEEFLRDDRTKARYVAWNGNRFDVRIVLDCIVEHLPRYVVTPFWAGMAGLRGAMVYDRDDPKRHWFFLDGIAMTGLIGWKLSKFMPLFAPAYAKFALDFEALEFDPKNPDHRLYAERDSEGLYHAMVRVNEILLELTGRGLQVTIGNAGIKYFQSLMPEGVQIWPAPKETQAVIDRYGKRGGYVFTARRFEGLAWSYDINQAYGAAMRETALPCGFCCGARTFSKTQPGVYVVDIERTQKKPHPFYCRRVSDDPRIDGEAVECYGEKITTVITSDEYRYLIQDGWTVAIVRGWIWTASFTMRGMIDDLEALRASCAGGPSGAIGSMIKAIGNNSYGKTGEVVPNEKYTFAATPPTATAQLLAPHDPTMRYFWFEIVDGEERRKRYHRSQIAMFITASVRVKLLYAIDGAPADFLKADTDSVTFCCPIAHLPISASQYGAWKEEYAGAPVLILGKKTYGVRLPIAGEGPTNFSYTVKGLRVKEIRYGDFRRWYDTGTPPEQMQIQTQSIKRGLGVQASMYRAQLRHGTNFAGLASVHKRDIARAWWEGLWSSP